MSGGYLALTLRDAKYALLAAASQALLYGLLFFPFLSKPILDAAVFKDDPKAFYEFLAGRKPIVLKMISSLVKPVKPVKRNTPPPRSHARTRTKPASSATRARAAKPSR